MSRAARNVRLGSSLTVFGLVALLVALALASTGCSGDTTSSSTTPAAETTTTLGETDFSDVPSTHVYAAQITDLAARGVVGGFEDGRFRPDAWVTRQQFAKMIVLAGGYPVAETDVCTFGDVQKSGGGSFYPDNYVAVCVSEGITQGRDETHFAPYDNVTRAQLITMVARAADLPEPPVTFEIPFGNFSDDHYRWAKRAYYAGLLDGLDEFAAGYTGGYDFWANASRGEACVLLYGFLHRVSETAE